MVVKLHRPVSRLAIVLVFLTQYCESTEQQCLPCPVGFYRNRDSAGVCEQCPDGLTTLSDATDNVTFCQLAPRTTVAPTTTPPPILISMTKLTFSATMVMSLSEFDGVKDVYIASIAEGLSVEKSAVKIESISTSSQRRRRRLLQQLERIQVVTSVVVASVQADSVLTAYEDGGIQTTLANANLIFEELSSPVLVVFDVIAPDRGVSTTTTRIIDVFSSTPPPEDFNLLSIVGIRQFVLSLVAQFMALELPIRAAVASGTVTAVLLCLIIICITMRSCQTHPEIAVSVRPLRYPIYPPYGYAGYPTGPYPVP